LNQFIIGSIFDSLAISLMTGVNIFIFFVKKSYMES